MCCARLYLFDLLEIVAFNFDFSILFFKNISQLHFKINFFIFPMTPFSLFL